MTLQYESDDPSISHLEIVDHMLDNDHKELVYVYEEGHYNDPDVDGVPMDIYSQLCWDVANTEEHEEGGMKCGFTITVKYGGGYDLEWDS